MVWLENMMAKLAARKLEKKLNLTEGPVDKKQWYKSKTVWAGVATFLIGAYDVLRPIAEQSGHPLPPIPGIALTFLGALGIYGRKTANTTIG